LLAPRPASLWRTGRCPTRRNGETKRLTPISTTSMRKVLPGNAFVATPGTRQSSGRQTLNQPLAQNWMTRADGAGGCDFAVASSLTARDTTVFWAPEANARVVLLASAPSDFPAATPVPTFLHSGFARRASDGLYTAHGRGRTAVYSLLLGETTIDDPIMAVVPFDGFVPERLSASERLWRTGLGRPTPDSRMTSQRRRRLCQMLRAVDGKTAGASHREIAEALFGRRRVEAELWHASSLRFATMRLVRDGQAMIGEGYRTLLRPRPAN
jgi:Uncharacterized conserved protein (DUF2285)